MGTLSASVAALGLTALVAGARKHRLRNRKTEIEPTFGLKEELCPNDPEIDICFVHGLTGDEKSTWTAHDWDTKQDVFWPTAFLECDSADEKLQSQTQTRPRLPRARILLYSYDTNVHSLCWLAERTLYHSANDLVEELGKSRIGCETRPLLFVAHSLGGLLVKHALIADRKGQYSPAGDHGIYQSTFGIVSFGTPQVFSGTTPLTEVVDRICRLDGVPEFEDFDSTRKTFRAQLAFLELRLNKLRKVKLETRLGDFDVRGMAWNADSEAWRSRLQDYKQTLSEIPGEMSGNFDLRRSAWENDIETLQSRLNQYKPIAKVIPEVFCYEYTDPKSFEDPISSENTVPPKEPCKEDFVHPLCRVVPLGEHHADMCKFTRPDKSFQSISESIQDFLNHWRNPKSEFSLETRKSSLSDPGPSTTISYATIRSVGFNVESELPSRIGFVAGTGRESRAQILKALSSRLSSHHHAVLSGGFGVGKTTMAIEYAHQQRIDKQSRYSAIFWVNAGSEIALKRSFERIHAELGAHYGADSRPASRDADQSMRAVLDWLLYWENKKWLLIYDDVEAWDAPYLQPFLPPKHRGYIIMTSRSDHLREPEQTKDHINFANFTLEDPNYDGRQHTELYLSSTERSPLVEPHLHKDHYSDSGQHFLGPKSLHTPVMELQPRQQSPESIVVGCFTRRESVELFEHAATVPPNDTTESKEARRLERSQIFDSMANDVHDHPLDVALKAASMTDASMTNSQLPNNLQFDWPDENNVVLNIAAILGPDPIPFLLLEVGQGMNEQQIVESLSHERAKGLVWVDQESNVYKMPIFKLPLEQHRFRRQILQSAQPVADYAAVACKAVVKTLLHLKDDSAVQELRASYERLILKHMDACSNYCLPGPAFVDCDWGVIAEFCEAHGRYMLASKFYQAGCNRKVANSDTISLFSWESWDNPESLKFAETWNNSSSQPTIETGSDETKTSRMLRNELGLIRVRIKLGEFQVVEQRCEKILQDLRTIEEERYILLRIGFLRQAIAIKKAVEEWSGVAQYSNELIDTLEGKYGSSATETVEALHEFAKFNLGHGFHDASELLLEQVRMTHQQEFGLSHPKTLDVSEDLARCYKERGDVNKARELYRWIIKTYREQLGEEHIQTARAKENLAIVSELMNRYENADDLYEEALHAAKLLDENGKDLRDMLLRYESMLYERSARSLQELEYRDLLKRYAGLLQKSKILLGERSVEYIQMVERHENLVRKAWESSKECLPRLYTN